MSAEDIDVLTIYEHTYICLFYLYNNYVWNIYDVVVGLAYKEKAICH